MTFAQLPVGARFKDVHAHLSYTKTRALPWHGKRSRCRYCNMPRHVLANAVTAAGQPVHFCADEEIVVLEAMTA